MSRKDLLTLAASTFGAARLVTTLLNEGLRPGPFTVLEVRGLRDGGWRPLGAVAYDQSNDLLVSAHPKALNEDLRRAGAVFNA
jgi:hypothetical protein